MTNATLVGSFHNNTGSSSAASVSVTLTSCQAGDLVVALVCIERSTATAGTPVTGASNSFTSDANTANTSMAWSYSHYTLVAADITAGSVTLTSTCSTSTRRQAIDALVFRGQSDLAFQGGTFTQNADGVVTATAPSITPADDDATIVCLLASISNVEPFIRTQSVDSPYTVRGNDGSTSASSTNAYVTGASRALTGGGSSSQTGATFNDTTSPTPTKFHWFAGTYAVGPLASLNYELTDGVGMADAGVVASIYGEQTDAVGITDSIEVTLPESLPAGTVSDYTFLVDWTGDGDFGDEGDDITSRVLSERSPVTIHYGRSESNDLVRAIGQADPGEARLALNNRSRDYSPENGNSPLVGNVGPGKEIAISATFGSFSYSLFRGFLDDYSVMPTTRDRVVEMSCLDGLGRLAEMTISTQLYRGVTTGQAVNYVLDAVGWPVAARDIDAGHSALAWWWEEGTSALEALRSLVQAEGPPALVTIDGTGQFVFRDRLHRLLRPASLYAQAVLSDTGDEPRFLDNDFIYDAGWRSIVNRVAIDVPVRQCSGVPEQVWSSDVPFTLSDGETVQITASSSDPFLGAIAPVVGTDFTLSSGAGVVCTLNRDSGASATISVTATSGAATVLTIALRASPVTVGSTAHISAEDSASIGNFGLRTYSAAVPWVNVNDAQAIAQVILRYYADRLPVIKFKLGGTPERLYQQLIRNLSDQVTVIESESGINGAFFIERIEHSIEHTGKAHSTWFSCEQAPAEITNPFRFDVEGSGFNQGLFTKDGAIITPVFVFDASGQGFNDGLFAN